MKRTQIDPIVDLAAAFLFLGMMGTGYILRFPLPPGTNKVFTLWGLTRHQWGSIHFWLSLGFLGIIFVHIVLHWPWIVTVIGKRLNLALRSHPPMKRSGIKVALVFISTFTLFALATHWSVKQITEPIAGVCLLENCPSDEPQITSIPLENNNNLSEIEFWRNIYPIFELKCSSCHGSRQQLGNFRIDRREDFFGKDNRNPLVWPGKSSESPLIEILSGARPNMLMADRHKLPQKELSLLKSWIDTGAKWSQEASSSAIVGHSTLF